MLTVDIDVGGTLTDGIFTRDGEVVCVKVDTTSHDLTVCLFDCIGQGAALLGYPDIAELLDKVDLIRWSTTITSNVLAEQRGPRLGLIVSRGHERDLYSGSERSLLLDRIISENSVLGMDPSAPENDVMTAVRNLLEAGVRRICVSFQGAGRDPSAEIRVKRIIDQQYPDHFLGSVPVLAGSDISRVSDDVTRTYCALINAYTHGALAATLFKAEDDLRETHKYTGTFLISQINGGVSGIAKTKAIDTMESGPILGVHGSSYIARALGIDDAVALDVGGTTAKVSVLERGVPIYRKPSDLFGIPVGLSLPYLRSVALGGGSYVRPDGSASQPRIRLGPESMGAYPGPACYGLGGDQATLTDAFVAGGLINPEYFLGGTKLIDRELASRAMAEQVGQPLGIGPSEACHHVIDAAFEMVADVIAQAGSDLGKSLASHALFAYGGNGGLFACGVAEKAGLNRVCFFNFGPVFSAFGSSVSDITHVYDRPLFLKDLSVSEMEQILRAVNEMKSESVKDLLGEGIQPQGIEFTAELEVATDHEASQTLHLPQTSLQDAAKLLNCISSSLGTAPLKSIAAARLRMRKPMPKYSFPKRPLETADAGHALKGSRTVAWGSKDGNAKIYRWEALQPGNRLAGCAILEGANSTYFVPDSWTLEMDCYGNAVLQRI